ncbi:fluoride efflux transporter CrcB [Mucilaginibacter sp.]|jgi:CrcB protein|uniref:fluoride efflux transporter CrcB n=1 Tax=Mucilaginibacter sp. TaxID=1882438 RepID=UPI002CCE528F|nr:fluoride efflux transporter CrcB [Mucilaginibacter sp.]HTI57480.1 fluoride efflux transporter CrcB [Mucilaginibacter sp.]
MKNILLIFIGGGAGSLMRYFLSRFINSLSTSHFPFGTFVVNVAGCFLIGFVIFYTERYGERADTWRLLLATGLCGGFTTFSTFSLESSELISEQHILVFLLYAGGSILLGLLATYLGLLAGRAI